MGEQKESTWMDAIQTVLRDAKRALHYTEIKEEILLRGLRTTFGATPEATVNAYITGSIKKQGDKSPFVHVSRGVYQLRELQTTEHQIEEIEQDDQDTTIRSFGMYWKRELVYWKSVPFLAGRELLASDAVDFNKQIGVYILYDNHEVIYVGRITDRPLGQRLFEHTIDRLSGRWNRFSWFGMYAVSMDGTLKIAEVKPTSSTLIKALEAILIETLEPPQNRRRGDGLNAIEYIQAEDPNLKAHNDKELLRLVQRKLIFNTDRSY
jgi:signal peptidase I